jgi:fructose-bisphosphate aldolase class 1
VVRAPCGLEPTLTRRFDTLRIPSTEQSRRGYREMLFTAPGVAEFMSGVILQDETIHQKSSGGTPLARTGKDCSRQASVEEVATATLRCLRRQVPAAVPGIVFLSGDQDERAATAHLKRDQPPRWTQAVDDQLLLLARAAGYHALESWHGRDENLEAGRQALYLRARCSSAASLGAYTNEMEALAAGANPAHRRDWRDD